VTNAERQRRKSGLRAILAVGVVAVILIAALFSAIGSLNRDVYSAGGFVRQYLDALAQHDTVSALALDGATPTGTQLAAAGLPQHLPETLLRASVLGTLDDIELRSDTETAPGVHSVVYDFRLAGKRSSMTFTVQNTGTFAGVFDSWRFTESPLAVLRVTVQHQATFTVNGLTLDTRAHAADGAPPAFSNQAAYLAFAPARYSFGHDSAMLTAAPRAVPVTRSGATDVAVDAVPNDTFLEQVQTEVNGFLDECAQQQVLQPSNCPFGITIDDRVTSPPTWSIAEYPQVDLTATETGFEMAETPGQAHIVVKVQSLFDGDVSTRDEDVPFAMGLSVTIQPDGNLTIQLH